MNKTLHLSLLILIIFPQTSIAIDKIEILGLFKDKAVVMLDAKRRVLKKGQISPEGALLISSNSEEAIIEINGEQKAYTLGAKISGSFTKSNSGKSVLITPDAVGGMYNVSGKINGFNVDFVVDTGATLISMNSRTAKRIGLDYRLEGKESVSYTASGKDKVYIVNLKRVRVGEIELRDVKAAVHEGDFPIVTLLGMSFLGKLDMKREGKLLELKKKY